MLSLMRASLQKVRTLSCSLKWLTVKMELVRGQLRGADRYWRWSSSELVGHWKSLLKLWFELCWTSCTAGVRLDCSFFFFLQSARAIVIVADSAAVFESYGVMFGWTWNIYLQILSNVTLSAKKLPSMHYFPQICNDNKPKIRFHD